MLGFVTKATDAILSWGLEDGYRTELAPLSGGLCADVVLEGLVCDSFNKAVAKHRAGQPEFVEVQAGVYVFLRLRVDSAVLDQRLSTGRGNKGTKGIDASDPELVDLTDVSGDWSLMSL